MKIFGEMTSPSDSATLVTSMNSPPPSSSSSQSPSSVTPRTMLTDSIIKKGFLKTDELFTTIAEKNLLRDGTTAVASFIHFDREREEFEIVACNAGDSRCVLSREGVAEALTEDHKPKNPEEYSRIIAAGGAVYQNRVQGDLALSRAIGDVAYKNNPRLGPEEQMVISTPDIRRAVLKVNSSTSGKDSFLILACDGIWDVMTNQVAVDFVQEKLDEQRQRARQQQQQQQQNIQQLPQQQQQQIIQQQQQSQQSIIQQSSSDSNSSATVPTISAFHHHHHNQQQLQQQQGGGGNNNNETSDGIDLVSIAASLIDHGVLELTSRDNMSAIIVLFKKPPRRGKSNSFSQKPKNQMQQVVPQQQQQSQQQQSFSPQSNNNGQQQ